MKQTKESQLKMNTVLPRYLRILGACRNSNIKDSDYTDFIENIFKAGALSQMSEYVYIGKPMSGVYVEKEKLTDQQIHDLVKEDFFNLING